MSRVFVGYGRYGIEGVDEEFVRFIFDITLSSTTKKMDSEVGLIIAGDEEIQKLNHRYRGKNQPTNVLSFTNQEMAESVQPEPDAHYLGDICIGYSQLAKEAKDLCVSEKERFAQLFVHGLLHLSGFDHENPTEAVKMEELEDHIVQLVL